MNYPADFIAEAQRLYPPVQYHQMHAAIARGDHEEVGLDLFAGKARGMTFQEIIRAVSLDDLQAQAQTCLDRDALYEQWQRITGLTCDREGVHR